ncbi:MAG: TM0106 family RecB-like putative nuclease [Pseudomonadota bacterium]
MQPKESTTRLTNASDAIAWKSCRRRAWFELREPEQAIAPDPFEQLIMHAGMEHERAVLERLGDHKTAMDEAHTADLMAARTPLIYQPKFQDVELSVVAQPDFLFLEKEGYRAGDAKLAQSMKTKLDLRIQLAVYQRVLGTDLPTMALLADDKPEYIGEKDLKNADEFLADMKELAIAKRPNAHYGASRCNVCPYRRVCVPEFCAAGDLGQNYFVDVRAIPRLRSAGVSTLSELASSDPDTLPDVPYFKGEKKSNAVLHAQALINQQLVVRSNPTRIAGPAIHFDIETNPLAAESAEEVYLWGFLTPPYEPEHFEYIWHDGGAESDREAWKLFLNKVVELRQRHSDAVFVHYARFEQDVIRRYAKAFDQLEEPTVDWLLNQGGLVDFRDTVVDSLILPTMGYGLKEICKHKDLVNFRWELDESGSQWSVVRYHDFLREDDPQKQEAIKHEILSYNRDDVRATRALEVWLNQFD